MGILSLQCHGPFSQAVGTFHLVLCSASDLSAGLCHIGPCLRLRRTLGPKHFVTKKPIFTSVLTCSKEIKGFLLGNTFSSVKDRYC